MPEREDRLLARAAAGDRRALARLYELHVDGLHAFDYVFSRWFGTPTRRSGWNSRAWYPHTGSLRSCPAELARTKEADHENVRDHDRDLARPLPGSRAAVPFGARDGARHRGGGRGEERVRHAGGAAAWAGRGQAAAVAERSRHRRVRRRRDREGDAVRERTPIAVAGRATLGP